jgi:hypothetical protein
MPTTLQRRFLAGIVVPLVGATAFACGPRRLAVIGPVGDPEAAAVELRDETGLEEPLRIVFDWELNDAGQRVEGRGVARVEPPYKARLDLFLDNGETVISAALVDGELRLPPGSPDDILPPPDLMWGALGVFRPEGGAELVGADQLEEGAVRLRYRRQDGTEVHYQILGGELSTLELLERGSVVQRVDVAPEREQRYPLEATYRNLAEFRELKLVRESLAVVETFDPEIWDPAQ